MHKLSQFFVLGAASFGLGASALVFFLGVVSTGVQTQVALAQMVTEPQTATAVLALTATPSIASTVVAAAPSYYCPKLSITLQIGNRDTSTKGQVSELQRFLSSYFHAAPSQIVSGYFGPLTQGLVAQFQQSQRLAPIGSVGPLTRAAIASVCGQNTASASTVSASAVSAASTTNAQVVANAYGQASTTVFEGLTIVTDPLFVGATALPGASYVTMARFNLDATYAPENVLVKNLPLSLAETGPSGSLNSCVLVYDVAGLSTTLNTGTNVLNPNISNDYTVPFDNPFIVPRGTVRTIMIRCNVSSTASGTYLWTVAADMQSIFNRSGSAIGMTTQRPMPTYLVGGGTLPTVVGPVSSSLFVTTDSSSPSFGTMPGGTTGVVMGVYKFRATGENVSLSKIGLHLTSGNAADVTQVYLYSGSSLIGTAVFAGNSLNSTSSLTTALTLPKDTDMSIVARADIANVGVNQPGTAGDILKIDSQSAQGTGLNSGATINAVGSTQVAGVQIATSTVTPASPILNYVNQTAQAVTVNYSNMPANAYIVFINKTSGQEFAKGTSTPQVSGSGTLSVPLSSGMISGAYYLKAQNASTGAYLAQTVVFYINNTTPVVPTTPATTTPAGTSCSYVPASGSASTITISGGSDACKAWCSSQALESGVAYSCSYNGVKVASAAGSTNAIDSMTLVASVIVAPYQALVDAMTNFFASIIVPQMTADVVLAGSTTQPLPHMPPHMASSTTEGTSTMSLGDLHCPSLRSVLQRGIKDATTSGEVSDLQQFLADHFNLNKDDVVSGFFGSTTQSLLKKFQQENNLPPVGIAGPLTRVLITKACLNHGMIRSQEVGNHMGSTTMGSSTMPRMSKGDDTHLGSTTRGALPPHGDDMRFGSTTGTTTPHMPPMLPTPVSGFGDNRGDQKLSIDLKVNGSNGPVSLADQDSIVVSWTSTNTALSACELVGAFTDETGAHIMHNLPSNGSETLLAWIPGMGGSVLSRIISISCTSASSTNTQRDYVMVRPMAPAPTSGKDNAGAVYEGVGEIGDGMSKLIGAYFSLFGL